MGWWMRSDGHKLLFTHHTAINAQQQLEATRIHTNGLHIKHRYAFNTGAAETVSNSHTGCNESFFLPYIVGFQIFYVNMPEK